MTIDKSKLQPLLWAVVGAWKAGDQDLHLRTDALDAFLGETTVEEVALGLLAEIDRLVPFEEAYATACSVRNRLIKEKDQLDQFIVANKVASDSFRAERDQLKAENETLRKRLEGLVHVSDATGWEKHTCGEIAKAKALLGMEVRHG